MSEKWDIQFTLIEERNKPKNIHIYQAENKEFSFFSLPEFTGIIKNYDCVENLDVFMWNWPQRVS